jgi:hypothetical protein
LLDTTFLIDAERTGGGLDEVIDDDDDVAIAAITVAELRVGVELSRGKARWKMYSLPYPFLSMTLAWPKPMRSFSLPCVNRADPEGPTTS